MMFYEVMSIDEWCFMRLCLSIDEWCFMRLCLSIDE